MTVVKLIMRRKRAGNGKAKSKIGIFSGLPALGLDGLSSSAYGPEAALAILIPIGATGLRYIEPITLTIIALLAMLYFSYRQTIAAYPANGGSYTVAKENLGTWPSLLAAAALMIDYVLTVAVGISAGVGALVSEIPGLHPFILIICLAILVIITVVNLLGTSEAGIAFALPTYVFIVSVIVVLAWGTIKAILAGGHPVPAVLPARLPAAAASVNTWLLLRSFASGCTAMTGVEAVSNGVAAFKEPKVPNAHRTLTWIVSLLALLLGGIAYLAHAYHVGAMQQDKEGYQSVLSQLIAAVAGRGWFYHVTLASVLAVLCLSANTSFVDFPRVCRLIAKDDFLPHGFESSATGQVYWKGILFLSITTGSLLVAFRGITDKLIPLFAVGAFLAFTLSQTGMVIHWHKQARTNGGKRNRSRVMIKLAINGLGALATASALIVILCAKFKEGAWITILSIPLMLTFFKLSRRHYDRARK